MTVRARTRSGRPVVIPAPQVDDFEDVHWALSAATTLWERGEDTEALKWLRRAASAAADRDADVRAVELFKAAADVAGVVDARQHVRRGRTKLQTHEEDRPEGKTQAMAARVDGGSSRPEPGKRNRSHAINRGPVPIPGARPGPPPPQRPGPAPPPRARRGPPVPRTGPPPPPTGPRLTQTGPPTRLQRQQVPVPHHAPRDNEPPPRSTEPRDLVPPVPPEPLLSERFAGLGYKLDDTEEDTFIRPETMLRRALLAIDPNYADRTDIDTEAWEDDDEEEEEARVPEVRAAAYVPKRPYVQAPASFVEAEEDTERQRAASSFDDVDDPENETTRERVGDIVAAAERRKSEPAAAGSSPGLVPGLAAFRVAVLPIPEERDVRLIFIPPGAEPPPGVAIALLVPPSPEDARMINEIYNDTDAKL